MAGAKLVVLYPRPTDIEAFERAYTEDHVPMVNTENMPGIAKFIETRVTGTADGSIAPYHRIAELHFDSMEALQKAASSEGAKRAVEHAVSISSGGAPEFLIAEEKVRTF